MSLLWKIKKEELMRNSLAPPPTSPPLETSFLASPNFLSKKSELKSSYCMYIYMFYLYIKNEYTSFKGIFRKKCWPQHADKVLGPIGRQHQLVNEMGWWPM